MAKNTGCLMMTDLGDPAAILPKGEPVANPPQEEPGFLTDPRELLKGSDVEFAAIEVGDWIRDSNRWRRPRLVLAADVQDGEKVLFLAEPGEDSVRRMRASEGRVLERLEGLTKIWRAAHLV